MVLIVAASLAFSAPAFAANPSSYLIVGEDWLLPAGLEEMVSAAGGQITRVIPEIGVAVATSENPDFAANAAGIVGLQAVTLNPEVSWLEPQQSFDFVADANPPSAGDNEPFFPLQWGLDAINAPEAWNTGAFGGGVRVAVLDSGIDADHPDLAPRVNAALSTSFVPGENWNPPPGFYFNHGTHVAGIIGAADNSFGVIGVAPQVELVAVQVLNYSGSGAFDWVVAGIVYAANIDADVINMSLGAYFPRHIYGEAAAELANVIGRATTYAYQQGTTVIASAGNNTADRDHDADWLVLPADAPHVLAISATAPIGWAANPTTNLDQPTTYSNYGQSRIDFAAPGGDFAYPGNETCTVGPVTRPCWVFDGVFSTIPGGWAWAAGTSMAAPHAAGVAALIISENGGSMSPTRVAAALRSSSDDLGKRGNDDIYGGGRVNAYNAVK